MYKFLLEFHSSLRVGHSEAKLIQAGCELHTHMRSVVSSLFLKFIAYIWLRSS